MPPLLGKVLLAVAGLCAVVVVVAAGVFASLFFDSVDGSDRVVGVVVAACAVVWAAVVVGGGVLLFRGHVGAARGRLGRSRRRRRRRPRRRCRRHRGRRPALISTIGRATAVTEPRAYVA